MRAPSLAKQRRLTAWPRRAIRATGCRWPAISPSAFSCGSWLLDPQLREYLPADSNIVRFQQRFELEPYEEPEGLDADVEVLRFVFRTLSTPLDQLPRRTVLQRAVVDHLKAGRHWYWRQGRFPI